MNPSKLSIILQDQESSNALNTSNIASKLESILNKTKYIKSLDVDLSGTIVLKQNMEVILKKRLSDAVSLEEFSLTLSQTSIAEDCFSNLIFAMPRVKSFTMNFSGTEIKSQSFEHIIENSMEFWEKGCLKVLSLNFSNTGIKNEGVDCLTQMLSIFSDQLEELHLNLSGCHGTFKGLCYLFQTKFPKLVSLKLNLYDRNVTDKALEIFAENALKSMTKLQSLYLWVSRSKITDIGASTLFNFIQDLKVLYLDLELKNVTKRSINGFIKNKVPKMASLTKFRMTTSDYIDTELRSTIDQLERTYNSA